jgi:uncharacterized membrane protein
MENEDRAETKLLSFILIFIIILVSLFMFIWTIFVTYNSQNEGVPDKSRFMKNKTERFGVARQEDIYIDDRDPNTRYTAHGRLITKD